MSWLANLEVQNLQDEVRESLFLRTSQGDPGTCLSLRTAAVLWEAPSPTELSGIMVSGSPTPIFIHPHSYLFIPQIFHWKLAPSQVLCLVLDALANTLMSKKNTVHVPRDSASYAVTSLVLARWQKAWSSAEGKSDSLWQEHGDYRNRGKPIQLLPSAFLAFCLTPQMFMEATL